MRLILLLACWPLFLTGQADNPDSSSPNFWQRYRPRIGLVYAKDRPPNDFYTQRENLIGVLQRDRVFDFTLGWQPWRRPTFLRAQLQLGYYASTFDHGISDSYLLQVSASNGFEEYIEFNNWQLGLGLQAEPLPSRAISPFFHLHFLLAIPTKLYYELYQSGGGPDFFGYREVSGGARLSPGWKMGTGIRIMILKHLCLSLGGYYHEQGIRVQLPEFLGRNLQKSILHLQNTGLQIGAQVGW